MVVDESNHRMNAAAGDPWPGGIAELLGMPGYSSIGDQPMTTVTVGKWGKNLAVRAPAALAETVGLRDGETVEIEAAQGDLLIRRSAALADARHRAEAAAAEMEAESRNYRLGDVTIRDLLEEGRRG
jgi:antitoxin MazE